MRGAERRAPRSLRSGAEGVLDADEHGVTMRKPSERQIRRFGPTHDDRDTLGFAAFINFLGAGISESELLGAFGGEVSVSEGWVVDDCTLYPSRNSEGKVIGVMVERPSTSDLLWNGLFQLLRRGDAVFYYPNDPLIPIVANVAAVKMMPDDMRASFGEPHVVNSAEELRASLDL